MRSEKDDALSDLEAMKNQVHDLENSAQLAYEEKSAQNNALYRQIEGLESQVVTIESQKLVVEEELSSVKAELKREHALLLENNHDETMNALEAKLIEITDKHKGQHFSITLSGFYLRLLMCFS